jgi:hypothetical protein
MLLNLVAGCIPAIYFDILSQFLNLQVLLNLVAGSVPAIYFDSISSQFLNLHVLPQFGGWTRSGHLF